MTEEMPLPPPFIVGEKYEDDISEYTVVSVEGSRMTFRRPDGTLKHSDDMRLKASIHKRRLFPKEHPRPSNSQRSQPNTGMHAYRDDEVTGMVAKCIDRLAKRSKDSILHKRIVECLVNDPETRRTLEEINRISADPKTLEGRAGQIIARFSYECYQGKWSGYVKEKISRGHAWRVKRR